MGHLAVERVVGRSELAKGDSDFTYFFTLLLAAEALAKTAVLGIVAALNDDRERNRYRLEHTLARADGIGDWSKVLEDALVGPASQYVSIEARGDHADFTRQCRTGEWQYEAVAKLSAAATLAGCEVDPLPARTDLKRWFRLFATLRNKTRAHGAMPHASAARAAAPLRESLDAVHANLSILLRPWAVLHRNISGKYRVAMLSGGDDAFQFLRTERNHVYPDGVYVHIGSVRRVPLMSSDAELQDVFLANGGYSGGRFEMLSYYSGSRADGDGAPYLMLPGALPPSDTEGHGQLLVRGSCFTNAPTVTSDYVPRPRLERELAELLLDDRRPIVTLVGRGGIGKTSLALRVLDAVYDAGRFDSVVWLSARDVDLTLSGPKVVRPQVFSAHDVGRLYAELVLAPERRSAKGFQPQQFFEEQLRLCDAGPSLFVFDNFETTQSPIELFSWIDNHVRLPNKVLITTRLRDFKGDYPMEVGGMDDAEARLLVAQTAGGLGLSDVVTAEYAQELIAESGGHPYVIKVLLGEVANTGKVGNVRRIVAGSEDILAALFERTFAVLTPCAQRGFLTLAAWNSAVPRLALEAVLVRSTGERQQVEAGVDMLLQYSLAEATTARSDGQEFVSLPLVAAVFGRKKLNVSPSRASIEADVELLQMLGPSKVSDVNLGLAMKLERFIGRVAAKVEAGEPYDNYAPIVEMMCRAYNTGWLLVARWHMEMRTPFGYQRAAEELRRFLEGAPAEREATDAWKMLAHACYQLNDPMGELHAFVERAQIPGVSINDVSSTASRMNELFRGNPLGLDRDQRMHMAERVLRVLDRRMAEADAEDLSRMAWLAIHAGVESKAREYATRGLSLEPGNYHCERLVERLSAS